MDACPVKELVSRTMKLALDDEEREKNSKSPRGSSPRRAPEEIGKGLEGWREETIDERDRDCCSICLDPFTEEDPEKKTTCKHGYHLQCIMMWSQRSKECPLCMGKLEMEDPETSELIIALTSAQEEDVQEDEAIGVDVEFVRILRHLSVLSRHDHCLGMEVGYPAASLRFHRRGIDRGSSASHRRQQNHSRGTAIGGSRSPDSGPVEIAHPCSSTPRRKSNTRQEGEGSPSLKHKSGLAKFFADFRKKFSASH